MNVCEFCSQLSDDAERAAITSLEAFSQEAEDDDYGDIPFLPAETGQADRLCNRIWLSRESAIQCLCDAANFRSRWRQKCP